MIAPVPYSPSTKLATQIGTGCPVNGLIARTPVSKPCFSMSPLMRAARSCRRNAWACCLKRGRIRRALGERRHQRMLRTEQHERRAVDRVDARREDLDLRLRIAFDGELHTRAFRPADPVPLHRQHLLGPPVSVTGVVEQLVGVGGDAEEPLFQIARLDVGATAPALAVDHLLVGEHGVVLRDTSSPTSGGDRPGRARTCG